MRYPKEHVESYRRNAGEQENHLIDEFNDGRVDRREFMRRGSVLGMGAMMTTLIAFGPEAAFARAPAVKRKQRRHRARRRRRPRTARSSRPCCSRWARSRSRTCPASSSSSPTSTRSSCPGSPRAGSRRPTRSRGRSRSAQGVKFHDGTPLTSDDVVATFERLVTKDSQALSSLGGVLSPGGTTKVDASTVKFDLDAANGFFPYLLGQMTYQAIILPKTYQLPADLTKPGEWTTKMNGTGPFKLKENRGQAGLSFVANDDYWGGRPSVDAVEFQVLEDNARVAALRGGQVDIAVQISYDGARQLGSGSQVLPIGTANHRYLNMNVKKAPFKDVRVRTAIALALGRPQIAAGLWGKYAQVGNDSPLWPGYAFTDKTVPQRKQDLAKAKALLKAAGAENLKLTLTCYRAFEMPAYAQRVALGSEEDRHQLQRQDLHLGAVLQRRVVRRQGQARPVALDRLRHRRLRQPADPADLPERGAQVRRRVERGALCQQEVRQDDRGLHRRERPAVAEEVREVDGDPAAQGHAGDLRLLLQLHRSARARRSRATCRTAAASSTCARSPSPRTDRAVAPRSPGRDRAYSRSGGFAQFAPTSHNGSRSASSRCSC